MGFSVWRLLLLCSTGSGMCQFRSCGHEPSCLAACGILPDQGLNPCPLHWHVDSQPLDHQGSPRQDLSEIPIDAPKHHLYRDERREPYHRRQRTAPAGVCLNLTKTAHITCSFPTHVPMIYCSLKPELYFLCLVPSPQLITFC